MRYVLRGAHVVDPANGVDAVMDVEVADGYISRVGGKIDTVSAPVVDCGGLHLFPGLIDVHVHFREPGQEYKETIRTGSRAAAAGGFTGVCAMPNTSPVNDNAEITAFMVREAADKGVCRVYPVGAISQGLKGGDLAHIGEMAEAGAVAFTDDGRPVESSLLMRMAMQYAASFGKVVISHSEDLSLAGAGVMNEGETSTLLGLPGIPAEAEETMVARDILLARLTGARVHLAHLSTKGSMELLKWGKAQGIRITGETAPHYLCLTDEEIKRFDANFKMNPPLRGEEDRAAAIEALASGVVDAVATDHAPHATDEKLVEFEAAPNGVIGLETSLGVTLKLYHEGKITLPRLVEAMSTGPARAIGLEGGHLAPGAPADMVLVDINEKWTVDPSRFHSKARNCPFAGMELKGRAVKTIAAGRLVYDEGRITAENLDEAEFPK